MPQIPLPQVPVAETALPLFQFACSKSARLSKGPRCVQNKGQNGTFLSKEIRKIHKSQKSKQTHANSCLLSPTGVGYLLRSVLKPKENTRKKSVHAVCPPEWDLLRSVLNPKI